MKVSALAASLAICWSVPFTGASPSMIRGNNQQKRQLKFMGARLEVWTSPEHDWDGDNPDGPNIEAFDILRKVEVGFGSGVLLEINQHVNSGDGVCPTEDADGKPIPDRFKDEICDKSCTNNRRYCIAPPTDDAHKYLPGSSIVKEALRRVCIWENTHNNEDWESEKKIFDYMTAYHARQCDLKGGHKEEKCVFRSLNDANIDPEKIADCVDVSSGGLEEDVDNALLSRQVRMAGKRGINDLEKLPAVTINGEVVEVKETVIFAKLCEVLPEEFKIDACDDLILDEKSGEDKNPVAAEEDAEEVDEELVQIAKAKGETEEDALGATEEEQENMAAEEEIKEEEEGEHLGVNEEAEEEEKAPEEPTEEEEGAEETVDEEEAKEEEGTEETKDEKEEEEGKEETEDEKGEEEETEEEEEEEEVEEEEELGEEAEEALEERSNPDEEGETGNETAAEQEGADAEVTPTDEAENGEEAPSEPETPDVAEEKEAQPENPDGADKGGKDDEEKPTDENTNGEEAPTEPETSEAAEQGEGDAEVPPTDEAPNDQEAPAAPETPEVADEEGVAAEVAPAEDETAPADDSEETESSPPDPLANAVFGDGKEEAEPTAPVDVPVEESSATQVEELNSVGEEATTESPQEMESAEPEVKMELEEPETTPEQPAEVVEEKIIEIDSMDMSLVDMEVDHLAALQHCGVDTGLLMSKIIALGTTGGKLKQETQDIESDLPLLMTQNCPHDEGVDILHRLRNFHGCAMFDLQELIETFPSTATGVALRCAFAYNNMTKEEEESGFIPEACIRTIEASSVLGRGLFGLFLYPDMACPCFEKLGDHIPECTADVWPIPINGALIKTQSCLVGQWCQSVDGLCNHNMKILNDCLPARGTNPESMNCDAIFEQCSAVYEQMHPMLNSAPLPDACVRIAQGSDFYGTHLVERYDKFRHQCGKNIELWEGHSKVSEFKSFMQEGVQGIDYQSIPFVTGAVGGFLAGVVFTIVFIIVRNICICVKNCLGRCWDWICCRSKKNKRNQRPKTKDYATIATANGDEVEAYHD